MNSTYFIFLDGIFLFYFLSCYWNVIKCGLESTYKNDEGFHWKMVSTDSLPCLCWPPSMFLLTPLCFLLTYLLPLTPSLFFTDLPLCFQWPLSVFTGPPLCFHWPPLCFHWPPSCFHWPSSLFLLTLPPFPLTSFSIFTAPPPPPPPPPLLFLLSSLSVTTDLPLCFHWPPSLFLLTLLYVSIDLPLCFHWPPSLFPWLVFVAYILTTCGCPAISYKGLCVT